MSVTVGLTMAGTIRGQASQPIRGQCAGGSLHGASAGSRDGLQDGCLPGWRRSRRAVAAALNLAVAGHDAQRDDDGI